MEDLSTLVAELSQPVATHSGRMKWMVDKTPDGAKSPNTGDAVVMVMWPVDSMIVEISDQAMQRAALTMGAHGGRARPRSRYAPGARW